jgi:hypothetical protein
MMASDSGLLYIMYIIGTRGEGLRPEQDVCCPVTAIMSFDSHLVSGQVGDERRDDPNLVVSRRERPTQSPATGRSGGEQQRTAPGMQRLPQAPTDIGQLHRYDADTGVPR